MKTRGTWIVLALCLLATTACTEKLRDKFDPDKYDKIDRKMDLSRDDYRNMAEPKKGDLINKAELLPPAPPPLPDLKQILAAPKPPELGQTQLVSIAVTDDVPLKDVLLELSRLANVDIELDANISGGVSFIAREKPFNEVIARISDLAGLRYTMRNGVLRVERDLAYVKNYSLDFLNANRSSTSSVNISTNVLSGAGGGGGGDGSSGGGGGGATGLNTGSTQTITSTTESDFWESLEGGIYQILAAVPAQRVAGAPIFALQTAPGQATTTITEAAPGDIQSLTGAPADPAATGAAAAATAVADATTAGAATGTDGNQAILPNGAFYILNRQAGILTVSGSDRQHRMVQEFIQRLRSNASSQVLIEAKIIEVALRDQYKSGIEWSALNSKLGIINDFNNLSSDDLANGVFTITLPDEQLINNFGGTVGAGDGNDFLQLISEFGTTRTLSNPRLHAINNQQAVLTFAQNFVYFELNVEREAAQSTGTGVIPATTTVDSSIRTVPIGIILNIQPSISVEQGLITLNVRPTLSRITSFVQDPAVAYLNSIADSDDLELENQIPIVEVRELDSILRLKSGQTMVIGGLMEDRSINNDLGVPGVSAVPWIGNLFKSVRKDEQTSELIIMIKATIIGDRGDVGPADQTIYKKFTNDPRPATF